jgi:hypothetical protein
MSGALRWERRRLFQRAGASVRVEMVSIVLLDRPCIRAAADDVILAQVAEDHIIARFKLPAFASWLMPYSRKAAAKSAAKGKNRSNLHIRLTLKPLTLRHRTKEGF